MGRLRTDLEKEIVDQEEMDSKYSYVDIDTVKSMLDEIENKVNACIDKFKIETLAECLEELKELSTDLY